MVFLTDRNMKRQFFRVKQLADQTFARAEKTEVLNDDLVSKEKRVELLRQVCASTSKKLKDCIQGQGTDGASIDRRLRKTPQFQLGSSMEESCAVLGKDTMLAEALEICGKMHMEFANILVEYEVAVEKLVLGKFLEIVDVDVPNIMKQKKQLNKLTLDYDSARTRHQTATRHSAPALGNTKADGLKEECEDCWAKMEQCRDQLAIEFYTLLAKEPELCQSVLQLFSSQQKFHEKSLKVLERCIPHVERIIETHASKPVYGMTLEEHLKLTGRKIALPLEACICWLVECGIHEEGLLRIAGSISKVKKLKSSFNVGVIDLKEYEPHAVAGALKHYLRELPEPLMTHELYHRWMETAKLTDKDARLQAMQTVVMALKPINYDNLRYVVKFLSMLSANQDCNKMSTQNIAIVMAPNLIWSQEEDQSGGDESDCRMQMGLANTHSSIVDLLISNADYFFPGEEEFFLGLLSKSNFDNVCGPLEYGTEDDDPKQAEPCAPLVVEELEPVVTNVIQRSNGSPKPPGSPKFNKRPRKPQAPKVPPLPKERPGSAEANDAARPAISPGKPSLPLKPRHERNSSNASVDLTTFADDGTAPSSLEPADDVNSCDAMVTVVPAPPPPRHHRRDDSGSSGEWPRVTPRAVQPKPVPEALKIANPEQAEEFGNAATASCAASLTPSPALWSSSNANHGAAAAVVPLSPAAQQVVLSEATAPGSPAAPKRPPRPQPRPPPVPVAKPRSLVQPEQTHL